MKFDVVVGNPPYQEDSGTSARDDAVYPYFYDLAEQISSTYCIISPARFLFNAGSTSKPWNQKMLDNEHLKAVYFNQNSAELFPNTDIKGGVVVMLHDKSKKFGPIGTFTSYPELQGILKKVEGEPGFTPIESVITGRGAYRLSEEAIQQHPSIESLQSKGHKNDIGSGAFKILDGIVFFDDIPEDGHEYIPFLGLEKSQRVYKHIRKDFTNTPLAFEHYKVVLPKANGSGKLGETLSTPLVLPPLTGFTETFISVGAFNTEQEAQNALKYIKSKFARAMLGVLKITQDNPKNKWGKVPLQNFSIDSDIDWNCSGKDLDNQFYTKYGLSEEEMSFIEEKVKPME
jgi:type II restriction enzyme